MSSLYLVKWKEAKKMFKSFRFEAKQSEKTYISFRLEAKWKNHKRNEAKQKILGSETKQKYGVFVSLWLEAKFFFFFHVSVRNGSRFASFRFEAKKFMKRNRHTLLRTERDFKISKYISVNSKYKTR